jgi:hypothetical protein
VYCGVKVVTNRVLRAIPFMPSISQDSSPLPKKKGSGDQKTYGTPFRKFKNFKTEVSDPRDKLKEE